MQLCTASGSAGLFDMDCRHAHSLAQAWLAGHPSARWAVLTSIETIALAWHAEGGAMQIHSPQSGDRHHSLGAGDGAKIRVLHQCGLRGFSPGACVHHGKDPSVAEPVHKVITLAHSLTAPPAAVTLHVAL